MDGDFSSIMHAIDRGDRHAASALLPVVYEELRRLADARIAHERPGQTLQATALVHEAYLRLLGPRPECHPGWDGRAHFFAAAAEAMRRILIDRARARGAAKRGGGARLLRLESFDLKADGDVPAAVLELDEALGRLAGEAPRAADLVKLRFFAGLTRAEAARVLGVSESTAERDWTYARAWLYNELEPGG